MKNITIIFLVTIGSVQTLKSQDFNDLIITKSNDTIHCKIGLINNYNIFYRFNPKKKKIINTYISRKEVHTFIVNSAGVDVQKQEDLPNPEPEKDGFAESNGIIYSTHLESPPNISGGIHTLYSYLEKNVKIYNRDIKIFKNNEVIILYKITIQEAGLISNATINQSSSYTGGFSYEARFLEEEIREVLMTSPIWNPAILDGKTVPVTVYLPLKFSIDQNKLTMLSSDYTFSFKNRKK